MKFLSLTVFGKNPNTEALSRLIGETERADILTCAFSANPAMWIENGQETDDSYLLIEHGDYTNSGELVQFVNHFAQEFNVLLRRPTCLMPVPRGKTITRHELA